nr:hypothetical protein [Saccharopolyspora pogona]
MADQRGPFLDGEQGSPSRGDRVHGVLGHCAAELLAPLDVEQQICVRDRQLDLLDGDEPFEGTGFEGAVHESGLLLPVQGGPRHRLLDRDDLPGDHQQEGHPAGLGLARDIPDCRSAVAQRGDEGVELLRRQASHRRLAEVDQVLDLPVELDTRADGLLIRHEVLSRLVSRWSLLV